MEKENMNRVLNKRKKKDEEILKKRRRNVLIVMAEIVVCLILCIACYGMSIINSYDYEELSPSIYRETLFPQEGTQIIKSIEEITDEAGSVIGTTEVEIPVEPNRQGYRNILILGTDSRSQLTQGNYSGVQTDVMIIASVNNTTGAVKLVSILRDTVMRMEEGTTKYRYQKANAQFANSGISDTISMINRNLGLDIQEYILVDWYGVARCIDQLGGIEMTIRDNQVLNWFNGYLSSVNQQTGIFAPQLPAPGTYTMTGTQVVAFCRIRYGGYNDDGRASHQREAIGKVLEKAKELFKAGDINTLLQTAQTGFGNVTTNLRFPDIVYTATVELPTYSISETSQFPLRYNAEKYQGNYPAKYNVLDPIVAYDFEEEVRNLHGFLFNDPNYQVSKDVKDISAQINMDRLGY